MIILDRNNNKWFITLTRYDSGVSIYVVDHYGNMFCTEDVKPAIAKMIEDDIIGINNQICWAELAFIFVKHNVGFARVQDWAKSNL